jgi:hypothetical protein
MGERPISPTLAGSDGRTRSALSGSTKLSLPKGAVCRAWWILSIPTGASVSLIRGLLLDCCSYALSWWSVPQT